MGRTLRRPQLRADDPRTARKLRKDSGVNLIHEEPWFGFNVADKLPSRNSEDPAGVLFAGLTRLVLEYHGLTEAELGDNEVTNRILKTTGDAATERAVSNAAVRTSAIDDRTLANQSLRYDKHPVRSVTFASGPNQNEHALPAAGANRVMVDNENIAGVGAGKIIGSIDSSQIGSLHGSKVSSIRDIPGSLPYAALADKPDLSRFLTAKDIQNRATKKYVEDYVKKHVKPSARR